MVTMRVLVRQLLRNFNVIHKGLLAAPKNSFLFWERVRIPQQRQ